MYIQVKCKSQSAVEEPYGKRLNRASWLEFRKCWCGYLILRTVSGVAAPIIPQLKPGSLSMLSLADGVESAAFGATVSILLTYLHSRRKGAEVLDVSRGVESSDLRHQVERLTPPKRTPAEQYHYEAAKKALEEFGEHRINVEATLRFVTAQGTLMISVNPTVSPVTPAGMKLHDMKSYLNGCVDKQLVTKTLGPNRSGAVTPVYDEFYSIAPGMKNALEELLYPPASS